MLPNYGIVIGRGAQLELLDDTAAHDDYRQAIQTNASSYTHMHARDVDCMHRHATAARSEPDPAARHAEPEPHVAPKPAGSCMAPVFADSPALETKPSSPTPPTPATDHVVAPLVSPVSASSGPLSPVQPPALLLLDGCIRAVKAAFSNRSNELMVLLLGWLLPWRRLHLIRRPNLDIFKQL